MGRHPYTGAAGHTHLLSDLKDRIVFVSKLSDLPTPVSAVITLLPAYTYWFTTVVDLDGNRLVAGLNTVIRGSSSENSRIKSTGLSGAALITSVHSLPMQFITIEADISLNLNGSLPTSALDWIGVNFTDCGSVGTIQNYTNFIATDCALLNSGGYTFDGTMGTIGFNSCIFDTAPTKTAITIPSTATITRRFRVIYSAFVSLSGETALNVSASATIPVEGYILDTCNLSGGGSYTTGVQYNDNKALFVNCRGIENSAEVAYYYMYGNANATTISATSTPYKIAGTTTNGSITQKFTHSNNKALFSGAITRTFKVSVTATMTSGNNQLLGLYIGKNGTVLPDSENKQTTTGSGRSENMKCQSVVSLAQNDYIEIFVENYTATTNITVTDLNVIIEALN